MKSTKTQVNLWVNQMWRCLKKKTNETKMGSSQKWTEKTMLVLELATYTGSL